MDDADKLSAIIIALCLLGSMFFSGGETAITAFGDRRAERLKEEGGTAGRALETWVDRPVWVLSTILLGNNVTNTLLGATATALAIKHTAGGDWARYAVPIAVLLATALLLIFGEIVPKAFGRVYSRQVAIPVLRVLHVLGQAVYPVVWVLTKITESVVGRARPEDGNRPKVTPAELGYLVDVAAREGTIGEDQAEMLQSVFRFEDKIARDLMVPLEDITGVDVEWDVPRIVETARESGHSRLPVYRGDLDEVVGVLHIKALVGDDVRTVGRERIQSLLRPPLFVSESMHAQDLLRRFQERRAHLAIVVDDAGSTVGVLTLEDVLEQLVGAIFDETDSAPLSLRIERPGMLHIDGVAPLVRVEERFGVQLPEDELEGVDSVGDLLTQLAGQVPIAGSVFVWEGLRFKVLSSDARHIEDVSIELIED